MYVCMYVCNYECVCMCICMYVLSISTPLTREVPIIPLKSDSIFSHKSDVILMSVYSPMTEQNIYSGTYNFVLAHMFVHIHFVHTIFTYFGKIPNIHICVCSFII